MQRQRILAVGLDRAVARAAAVVADRAGFGLSRILTAHDALRHLASVADVAWTVVVPARLPGLEPAAFVTAARDLVGSEAKIVVTGIEPVSAHAATLIDCGATTCVVDADHLHHPSLALGLAA